jgi:hypothetical protein
MPWAILHGQSASWTAPALPRAFGSLFRPVFFTPQGRRVRMPS